MAHMHPPLLPVLTLSLRIIVFKEITIDICQLIAVCLKWSLIINGTLIWVMFCSGSVHSVENSVCSASAASQYPCHPTGASSLASTCASFWHHLSWLLLAYHILYIIWLCIAPPSQVLTCIILFLHRISINCSIAHHTREAKD